MEEKAQNDITEEKEKDNIENTNINEESNNNKINDEDENENENININEEMKKNNNIINDENENENESKDATTEEEEKNKKEDKEEDDKQNEKEEETPKERSTFSMEGAKRPLSMYTRRVLDASKIEEYLNNSSSRGQCGGRNLGNTCFMNSSIACLSNCTELTYYFLKGDYKKDINEENRLGMGGELAKSWGELLQEYWVERTRVGDPSDFKRTIGRKAKIFRGYGQQDSNEFMSIFLDIINEDLNKTTKKQYIEMKEKGEDETDEQCARRFWECNLKRNDSIITDLFCGQFKSTITCPECGWINITFDPFDTINLPLLTQTKKRYSSYNEILDEFKLFYIPKYGLRNSYKIITRKVNRNEPLYNVINRIKKEENFVYHDKLDNLIAVDMLRERKYGFVNNTDAISRLSFDQEYIFSYTYNKNEDELKILVYFYVDEKKYEYRFPRIIFGKKNMTVDELRKNIYINLRKYILSPFLKENEEKDSLSLEIEKYIKDKNLELDENKLLELIEKEYQQLFKNESEEKENEDEETKKDKNEENNNEKQSTKEEETKEGETKEGETKEGEKKEEEKKEEEKKEETKKDEEDENKKCIDNFINDMPFTIYLDRENANNRKDEIFIDKDHFKQLPKRFHNLKSYKDILDNASINFQNYEFTVVFNENSKYINKDTFDLDYFEEYSLDYVKKKETPKKKEEEEEEDNGKMTLEKCLKKFCKEEQLGEGNEWYCSKCKKHVLAKKKMELYYLPKILIICFKRFIKDSYRWEKNDDEVDFPINNMDMKNFVIGPDKDHSVYDLFAVSQHYGSTGFGHYTAVCKNDGKWFSYNDSSCSETSENDALSSAAYVLFYRRQTD